MAYVLTELYIKKEANTNKNESRISLELFQRCTPTAIANGLRFKVQGFKFKGTFEVEYNEGTDLFDVRLIKNGKVVETVEDVYLDSLSMSSTIELRKLITIKRGLRWNTAVYNI